MIIAFTFYLCYEHSLRFAQFLSPELFLFYFNNNPVFACCLFQKNYLKQPRMFFRILQKMQILNEELFHDINLAPFVCLLYFQNLGETPSLRGS